jgi:hypothetical protein
MKLALFYCQVEAAFLVKYLDCWDIFLVFFQVVTVDENVIQNGCAEYDQKWT